ncbi:MAG: heme-binding protein [Gemmataceae bacterium]
MRRFSLNRLTLVPLESRLAPSAVVTTAGPAMSVTTDDADQRVAVTREAADVVVRVNGDVATRFDAATVTQLTVTTGTGNDRIEVAPDVTTPVTLDAGNGRNLVRAGGGPAVVTGGTNSDKLAGGSAFTTLLGGGGVDRLVGGTGTTAFDTRPGRGTLENVKPGDAVAPNPADQVNALPAPAAELSDPAATEVTQLSLADVQLLLDRATAATSSRDGIIVVVDRNGRILGVRVEDQVSPAVTGDPEKLVFAVDGAVAKARTGAFFGNDQAPLTSRTIQFLSQSTVTEREVNADPNVTDPNSPLRGPGYVAAVGVGGHFPPGIANTPPVDLFGIEHTNRDGQDSPGPDGIKGTPDDIRLRGRFNIDPAFVPAGHELFPPDSYGVASGLLPTAQSRGIATLPGGVPVVRGGHVVGGIGVFFPGQTGFATEENNARSTTYDPSKPDRTLEAEFIAFAAVGGSSGAGFKIDAIGDAPALPADFDLPGGPKARIDLVGITLDVFGPGGVQGPENLVRYGLTLGFGSRTQGRDLPVTPGGDKLLAGRPVPEGWLVTPHDGAGITAAEVTDIIGRGFEQATRTRAAIRQLGSTAGMVFAVTDLNGDVVGLYRMPDATVFSIDVAVAKARNVRYYADPAQLQPADQVAGVPAGTAFTNRTFRYLAQPRFPLGFDGTTPAPFSILRDGGSDPLTGRTVGAPLPASAFQSVYGHDSFNPGTNFHDPFDPANQNGIVFFPGSAPLYRRTATGGVLAGGFGVSGDGVDQDDVVTFAGTANFGVPLNILRADQVKVAGVRLPYQKFNRNPEAAAGLERFAVGCSVVPGVPEVVPALVGGEGVE